MDNIEKDTNQRATAILLLWQMINGQLTAQEVIDKWPKCPSDVLLNRIYCLLYHWRDDEDIRKKDHKYATWQKKQFEDFIAQLENRNE
ncbi:MAG: hypothetical protein WBL85_09180 [Sedimentisphaerales bacterium]